MPINYKDINQLTEKTSIAGTEKVPVSGTKFVYFTKFKDWIINSLKTTGLDLGGNQIKNVAIDVVTSLPTTGNFDGRRVTYKGRDYIWDGSAWKNDSDYLEIGGRNLITSSTFENGIAGTDWKVMGTLIGGQVDPFGTNKACLVNVTHSNSYLLKTTPVFKSLGEHTISVWMRGTKAGTINIQMQDRTYKKTCNLTTVWQKYELTANITSLDGKYRFVFGGWSSWTDLDLGVYFAFPKLEKGNIPTDWTPAPEDKADVNHNHDTTYLGIDAKSADSDKLDGKHYSDIQSDIQNAKTENFGYRYAYDLIMYGDHDKYYPFVIAGGDQNVKRDILIKRSFAELHPAEWYSSTHGGGLTLKIKTNFGSWGGANYGWEIHELEQMYNETFAGAVNTTSYMTFSIFLRGGGVGGAIYHVYSNQPIERLNYPVHIDGQGTSGNFPMVFYNSETVRYQSSQTVWVMPSYRATPSAEEIRLRKFIKLTQDNDTRILGLENQTINFNTNNTEPTQSGTVTKTSTWLWQYLTQSINFLWLKLKKLFPLTQATTHNYLPKIDNANKKLVKSNISDNGTTPKYGANTIWHSGNLGYDKLGDMPVATESEVGGIKLGYNPKLDADLLDGKHASDFATSTHNHSTEYLGITEKAADSDKVDGKHASDFAPASARANRTIKVEGNDKLGSATINPLNFKSGDDAINIEGQVNNGILDIVFSSVHAGIPTTYTNFNSIIDIGSYKVSGGYYNAPSRNCGTNTSLTASMKGTLNVFRSGSNNWETIQQLFWVLNGVTEQYQRSYDGTTWTIWKRLIKCDDYADPTTGKGGIISAANISELFRAPDLIQLWNESDLDLSNGVFHLDDLLPIVVSIENILHLDGNNISGLVPERRYRVTYDVLCAIKEGEGEVTIRIKDGNGDELCYITEYLFDYEFWKSTTFSIIITNTDIITPSIEVSSKLGIILHGSSYRVIVEEIKFPFFYPNN